MDSDSEPKNDLPKPSLPKPNIPPPVLPSVPPPSIPPVGVDRPSFGAGPGMGPPVIKPKEEEKPKVEEVEGPPPAKIGEAPLGSRIVAGIVDVLIAALLAGILGKLSTSVGWLASIGYLLVKDSLPFLDGQSIGKKIVKTKAVTEDGASLAGNWTAGVTRNASICIVLLSWVELVVLLINKDEPTGLRRLGDQWAKTKVITWPPVEPVAAEAAAEEAVSPDSQS